jgi:Protein of unknown function (DUF3810)
MTRAALVLAALAAVAALVPLPPEWVESAYSMGVYPWIQQALTTSSNRTAIALFDALILGTTLVWIALLVRDLRRWRWTRALAQMTVRTVALSAAIYLAFLMSWGLNYRRITLEDRLGLDSHAVTADAAARLGRTAAIELNRLYPSRTSLSRSDLVDPALAQSFEEVQRRLGASRLAVPARPKHSILDWYFRAASIDGMTDPFLLETLTPSSLLVIERPMILAHEWAHLAGYADEGEANFVGWLTCLSADDAGRYSAWLFMYSEVVGGLPADARRAVAASLEVGPRDDLRAISDRLRRDASPIVSTMGWRVYDQYLKANGVERGTRSYTDVVRLVLGTELGVNALSPVSSSDPSGANR